MPIRIPHNLPATNVLREENIFVMTDRRADSQHIRPLRLILLNLMPTKIATETQILRKLSNSPIQVEVQFMRMASHVSKNTSAEHLEAFYTTFDAVRHQHFDGMIITGAPVEKMAFEDVDYWPELCEIMDWSTSHVHSTLHICWGAQAGAYYHYGIPKYPLPAKLTGIFEHEVVKPTSPLVRGFDDFFNAPHSRNTEVLASDIEACPKLENIAISEEAGAFLCKSHDDRHFFVFGHPEYDVNTLGDEYERDLGKMGDAAPFPQHYFPDDDPTRKPRKTWSAAAQLLYTNWLNYYVYQTTPFDVEQAGRLVFDEEGWLDTASTFHLTLQGKDQVGILASVTAALARLGVAIDDISQDVQEDTFRLEIDAHPVKIGVTLAEAQDELRKLAETFGIGMEMTQRADA